MLAVLKKELKTYFLSPIGYVFIGLFLLITSVIFYTSIFFNQGLSNFEYLFGYFVPFFTFIMIFTGK